MCPADNAVRLRWKEDGTESGDIPADECQKPDDDGELQDQSSAIDADALSLSVTIEHTY